MGRIFASEMGALFSGGVIFFLLGGGPYYWKFTVFLT